MRKAILIIIVVSLLLGVMDNYNEFLQKPLDMPMSNNDGVTGTTVQNAKLGELSTDLKITQSGQIVASEGDWKGFPREYFTYASSSSIAVNSIDASLYFQKGDKLKIVQGATTLYVEVFSVTSSLISITNTPDYSLSNSSIDQLGISRLSNPSGWADAYTDWSFFNPALFTYLSDSKISVSTIDATKYLQVGDKVILKQTTAKYFTIISVTSNTITLNANASYSLSNATISYFGISRLNNPSGFTIDNDWTFLSPTDFSYVDANTLRISASSEYNKFKVGTRITLYQNSAKKYFVVIDKIVATLDLKITAGSSYTFTNGALSYIAFSEAVSPSGYPTFFAAISTAGSAGGMTISNQGTLGLFFSVIGDEGTIWAYRQGSFTTAGTAYAYITETSPLDVDANISSRAYPFVNIYNTSSYPFVVGTVYIAANSGYLNDVIYIRPNGDSTTNWRIGNVGYDFTIKIKIAHN